MASKLDYLKSFEHYCIHEDAFEKEIWSGRPAVNFNRIMKEMLKTKPSQVLSQNTEKMDLIQDHVTSLPLVHNTSLDCLISILQHGSLYSINDLEKKDILFDYRIPRVGINEEFHQYVYCTVHSGCWIHGLYEIRFNNTIETISDALFLPVSHITYEKEELDDYFMPFDKWRTYLTQYIALKFESVDDYLRKTPSHLRPEILFKAPIPVTCIAEIICSTPKAYTALLGSGDEEMAEDPELFKKIKVAEG